MGEYVLLDGQPAKLGTCEDLYYCRHADLAEWVAAGRVDHMPGNLYPSVYLDGGFRFRFPFPDEDGPESARLASYAAEYDRGVLIPYPRDLLTAEIEHYQALGTVTPLDGRHYRGAAGYAVRATCSIPCPYDANQVTSYRLETLRESEHVPALHYHESGPWVELVQLKPVDGVLVPVFRCPWCNARWRVTLDDAAKIAAYVVDLVPELAPVVARMVDGSFLRAGEPRAYALPD